MLTAYSRLKEILQQLPAKLNVIDEETALQKPNPKKWSRKEILGHLVDSASNNHQRFVRAQLVEELHFRPYEQERWVSTAERRAHSGGAACRPRGLFRPTVRDAADRPQQRVLRLVVLGHRGEILVPGPRQVLLGQDALEHGGDSELLPLLAQPERLRGGRKAFLGQGDLVGERADARPCLHDLSYDALAGLLGLETRLFEPGARALDPARVEEAARTDAPTDGQGVVPGATELSRKVRLPAPETAQECDRGDGGDQGAEHRSVLRVP